jgi:hypothetical protein
MSGRDLLRAYLHTIKDGLAAPDTPLAVYGLEDFFVPLIPGIDQKTISLSQHGRPQELRIQLECRAGPEADPAENAIDIRVDLLPFVLWHNIFRLRWNGFSVKIRFYGPVVAEKHGHVDDKIPDDGEVGKGFNQGRSSQKFLHMGSAGQH